MIRIIIVAMLCCSVAWGQLEMGSSTNVSAHSGYALLLRGVGAA